MNNDLISREALKKVLSDPLYRSIIKDYGEILKYTFVMDIIDNAPTVSFMISPDYVTELQNLNKEIVKQLEEAERPHGEWKQVSSYTVHCSCCNNNIPDMSIYLKMNFCPKCGADMRSEAEE